MIPANIGSLIAIIGLLITVAGLIGASFRIGRNAQTVNTYREAANAWESKAKAQADEIDELRDKLAVAEATIEKMQARLKLLEEMVTGRIAITDLTIKMEASFASLQAGIESLKRVS
jgi:hypothetical protein